ncbi:helix-hairpin-helix domain-containing protein [Edaphobacter sp. HDX4]|uniref:helix-hairpin-helix domain-containing protein n=1 Tax=Edaphobacter sp. HDX4 TaxID=2794064 RepID=UPI002FE6646A
MSAKGIDVKTQDLIVENISSFALYGFPESHAASFALLAYASAYFKVKYLAAFTCAILNNQPMGFYSPAVLIKDAQRHGLRVKPIDVQQSEWNCTLANELDGSLFLRLGLRYAKGLRRQAAEALLSARKQRTLFSSLEDLAFRVPSLNRKELVLLAQIGALNKISGVEHRRDALWQIEKAGKREGALLCNLRDHSGEGDRTPLLQMNTEERLVEDYRGTGLTTGNHPMFYRRAELRQQNIFSAHALKSCRNGDFVRVAGCVITRQRPGTAKGFIFLSIEDETGIANVVISPSLYENQRLMVTRSKFLLAEGMLQNLDDVIHVRATKLTELHDRALEIHSHDFH